MDAVLSWLLEPANPAVRARALVDLVGRSPDDDEVVSARQNAVWPLLDNVEPGPLYRPKYGAPFHRLVALAEMGIRADTPAASRLLESCLAEYYSDWNDQEVCLTGNLARSAWLMGRGSDPRVERAVEWLIDAQLPDGGWHCWPDKDDPRGTLDSWEALGAFAAMPPDERPRETVARGVEFLLEQGLGMNDPYEPWHRIHYPRHYYYDALVGLELATTLVPTRPDGRVVSTPFCGTRPSAARDARLQPAIAWLQQKRGPDGRWRVDRPHPDIGKDADYEFRPGEVVTPLVIDSADKWVTLAALRVLRA